VTNFLVIGWGVSILWGVENCPFPLTKPVAVNTGLELPRSLWLAEDEFWLMTMITSAIILCEEDQKDESLSCVSEGLSTTVVSLSGSETHSLHVLGPLTLNVVSVNNLKHICFPYSILLLTFLITVFTYWLIVYVCVISVFNFFILYTLF